MVVSGRVRWVCGRRVEWLRGDGGGVVERRVCGRVVVVVSGWWSGCEWASEVGVWVRGE